MVTHQLQVERRTGKVRQSETDVLPLCHAANLTRVVSDKGPLNGCVLLLSVCLIRSSAVFDDDVDQQSREYQDDEYDRDSVASKQSGNRSGQASTRGAYQWPERGQAALGVKQVIRVKSVLYMMVAWMPSVL